MAVNVFASAISSASRVALRSALACFFVSLRSPFFRPESARDDGTVALVVVGAFISPSCLSPAQRFVFYATNLLWVDWDARLKAEPRLEEETRGKKLPGLFEGRVASVLDRGVPETRNQR